MNPQIKNILRWIAVLPAAFLGAVITPLVILMMTSKMVDEVEHGSFWSKFLVAGGAWTMGIGFVYFGTLTAPSYKKIVACVLAVIGLLLCGAAILISIQMSGLLIYTLSTTAGVGMGFYTTLKYLQEEEIRPFKIVVCGVLTCVEVIECAFKPGISKFRPGPVTFEILTATNPTELYADLEVRSVDLIIFLNIMSFGGGGGRRNADPNELLSDIFERTHKPIIAMSAWSELNQKLRRSSGFVIMDMPFQLKEVEVICENLLRQNGYLLK